MYELTLAVCVIIFYVIIMPILDNFAIFVQSAFNRKIHQWQLEMKLDEAEANAASEVINPNVNNVSAIGFQVPQEYNGGEWCNK